MSKKLIYFSAAVCAVSLFSAENAAARNTVFSYHTETIQHFHQGKFSSEKG